MANEIGRPSQVVENRLNAQRDLNAPMACDRCGSTYFEEMRLYQYSALAYGSNDYKILSSQAKPMLRCICGYIRVPQARHVAGSNVAKQSAEAFISSASAAKSYIDRNSPENFAKSSVSPSELRDAKAAVNTDIANAVAKTVTDLTSKFEEELEKLKALIPTPKASKTVTTGAK